MLAKLFGSNTRVKILKLFLLNPGNKFYIRQIARILKLQLNSVRRELENLENFGLLTSDLNTENENVQSENSYFSIEQYLSSSERNNEKATIKKEKPNKQDKKYYLTNTRFVLYEEIKALVVKAQMLYEKDFVDKLHKAGTPKLILLSGFFVNRPNLPVDLFIVGRFNKIKLTKLIKELETELSKEINYTIMDIKEFKYRKDITDIFLYDILGNEKIVVIDEIGIF